MTYYGAEKVVPHTNVMGVAKRRSNEHALPRLRPWPKRIRVNCISAGPVNTLARAASPGLRRCSSTTKLTRRSSATCSRRARRAGVFLASDAAAAITARLIYVDCGYQIMGCSSDHCGCISRFSHRNSPRVKPDEILEALRDFTERTHRIPAACARCKNLFSGYAPIAKYVLDLKNGAKPESAAEDLLRALQRRSGLSADRTIGVAEGVVVSCCPSAWASRCSSN